MLLGAQGQRGDRAGAAQEPPAAPEHGAASRRVSFLAEAPLLPTQRLLKTGCCDAREVGSAVGREGDGWSEKSWG